MANTFTVVAPALVSQFEAKYYWNGISDEPPELFYRSDLDSNPFPHPKPGDRWFQLPVKTASSVSGTALNKIWHEVAPLIITLFKQRGVSYSVLKSARVLIVDSDEGDQMTMGPVVVWIALHPDRHTDSDARDVSPDVLRILAEHGVKDAVVEWYEGAVEKLICPPLLRVTNDTSPSYYVRRTLTAALGMPIAAKEMEDDNFHDITRRSIGWVDWAPKIAIDVDSSGYSRDIGTFELDPSKFSANFKGNVVDLGNKIDLHKLNRISGSAVSSRANNSSNPTATEDGKPVYIVAKDGCGTDLTVGRYSELEAYLCSESGKESKDAVIYNYSKTSGSFSGEGDSGSLIFTGDGRMLAVLHSGMPASRTTYKHADFDREAF
ncbi:hypothetical protein OH76DRAFT_1559897 [Lentinus brumalis]|uniref:Uncharacterized protein n=1 Tax=Lentinus brumalis TaxID=2498619 RepID=A0A371CV46_9APHY|nr:hypothetical protein OH76DRAFT_1559897 [Polyporus brumalis]